MRQCLILNVLAIMIIILIELDDFTHFKEIYKIIHLRINWYSITKTSLI